MYPVRLSRFLSVQFVLLGLAVAQTAAAAEPTPDAVPVLDEVIVTATLRPTPALELPASVTVLERGTLQQAGLQHLQDVLPLVPNLNWASGSSRPRYFQLRGIGETDQWQGAPNPSVGFLIDGMDFSGIGMPAMLLDLEQVEVLRGPQGTTFGANALAGLLHVRSPKPSREPQQRWEASWGEAGVASLALVGGGALGEQSAWRIAAQRYRADGARDNEFLGRDDTNGLSEDSLRWRSTHRFSSRWQADWSLLAVDQDNGFDAFSIDNSRRTRSDDPGRDRQRSYGMSLQLLREGAVEFRSVTALVDADILYSFDGDWGFDPNYDFTSRFLRERQTLSQDWRWSSNEGGWIVGLYGLDTRERNDQLDLYGGDVYRSLKSDYRARHAALYGSLERALSSRWTLTVGARLEHRDADYTDTDGTDLAPGESMWGGNLSLGYRLDTHQRVYVSLARGYKAGGFNIGAVIPRDRREFAQEGLNSIELGYKALDPNRRWRLEANLFLMRRADQQVSTSAQLDPGDPLSFIYLTGNAARGENAGLEASFSRRLSTRWQLSAAVGVLRTRFLDYVTVDRNLAGREQAHAPARQATLSAEYRHEQGWFARADLQRVAAFYFSDSHDERSRSYSLLNLRAGYESSRWRVDVWARNALDDDYAQRGFFFGNEPPDFPNKLYVQLADPRRVGLNVNWTVH
ncbi:MAG: hypothetical protein RLZZ33_1454 [Pseudomonadota bacterium]